MISLNQQIEAVKREIALRKRVYPAWVTQKRMKQPAATFEIEAMEAVLSTLEALQRGEPIPATQQAG
jgi:hypothetical protein